MAGGVWVKFAELKDPKLQCVVRSLSIKAIIFELTVLYCQQVWLRILAMESLVGIALLSDCISNQQRALFTSLAESPRQPPIITDVRLVATCLFVSSCCLLVFQ